MSERFRNNFLACCLVVLLLSMFASCARASTFYFNPDGKMVGSVSSSAADNLVTGFPNSSPSPPGFRRATFNASNYSGAVANAVVTTEAVVGAAEGAAVVVAVPTVVTSAISGEGLAAAAVKGLRGGLVGAAIGVAVSVALEEAHLAWDSLNKTMVYNPPVGTSAHPAPAGYRWHWGNNSLPYYDSAEGAVAAVQTANMDTVRHVGTCRGSGASLNCDEVYSNVTGSLCPISAPCTNVGIVTLVPVSGATAGVGAGQCPNGVIFNDTTQCKQNLTDVQAVPMLSPQITGANGPQIAHDLNGQGQDLPTIGGPVVTMSPTSTSGPLHTTYPDGSGSTTTTNTTNSCTGSSCNVTVTNTTVTTNSAGGATGTTTTTVPNSGAPAGVPDIKVCGLPGGPACRIDEQLPSWQGAKTSEETAGKAASDAFDAQIKKMGDIGGGGGGLGGFVGMPDLVHPSSHAPTNGFENVIPDGSGCTGLSTSYHGAAVNLGAGICPVVAVARPWITFFAYMMTMIYCWARIYGGRVRVA